MRRPIIAITATSRSETPGEPERVRLNGAYVDAVLRAGGVPVVSPPAPAEIADDFIRTVDALLLTGGEDVDPALFGATPHPALGRVTRARDLWEIALARAARTRGMPTLGVCRGIQVLNVAFGGTLIQDIPAVRPGPIVHAQEEPRGDRTHLVRMEAGSALATMLGAERCVNSMHHQAVAEVAPGFSVTATAPDGLVEGLEWTAGDWWCLGVQWHPEELDGEDVRLFTALAGAAGRRA